MRHRSLFFAIELNLVLWLAAGFATAWETVVVLGLVVSAIVQHWAYYALVRDRPKPDAPEGE